MLIWVNSSLEDCCILHCHIAQDLSQLSGLVLDVLSQGELGAQSGMGKECDE